MAENTVSNHTSFVNENSPIRVEFITENTPAVRSDILAEHFNRSHKNVLRDIAKILSKCPESFRRLNFEPTLIDIPGPNGAVRQSRAYLLTRDAFSLLVMGFTGKAAIQWKLRYIEAFNALEAAVRENIRTEALVEGRRDARRQNSLATLERALAYMKKGLKLTEAAKLVDVPARTLHGRLARLGLLPRKPARPVQSSLLTGGAL